MFYDTKLDDPVLKNKVLGGVFSRTYDYFGYSTASCYDKQDGFTYVFVSAPRSKNIRGKVDYMRYYGSPMTFVMNSQFAKGSQIGSYFGASLTCGYTKPSTVQGRNLFSCMKDPVGSNIFTYRRFSCPKDLEICYGC